MNRFADYPRKVDAVLARGSEYISEAWIREARDLANNGEEPLGLGLVGWEIVQEQAGVPASLVAEILTLSAGHLTPGVDIPENLEEFAGPDADLE